MKRVTQISEIKTQLRETGNQCYLCGVAGLHYSGAVLENVDPVFPNSVAVLCKECSARRHKRPIHVYVPLRFAQVAAEYAKLAVILGKFTPDFEKETSSFTETATQVRQKPNPQSAKKTSERKPTLEELVTTGWGDDEEDEKPAVGVDVSRIPPDDPRLNLESAMFDHDIYHAWCEYHENN
jgi:hypothetical protein